MKVTDFLNLYQFIIGIIGGIFISCGYCSIRNRKEQIKIKLLEFKNDIFLNGDLRTDMMDKVRKNDIHHISFKALILFDNMSKIPKRFYDFKVVFYKRNMAMFTVFCDKSQEFVRINRKSHMLCNQKYVNVLKRETNELELHICINVNDYHLIQNTDEILFICRDIREKEFKLRLFQGSVKNTIRSKFFEA